MESINLDGFTVIIIIVLIAYIAGLLTAIMITTPKVYR